MLQAALTGIPILFVVERSPQAYYMVQVFMIFITCSAILLLIFVPKIVLFHQYNNQPEVVQRARIQRSIRSSTVNKSRSSREFPSSALSVLSDEESGRFRFDPSQRNVMTFGSAVDRHQEEQAPSVKCNCNCHRRSHKSAGSPSQAMQSLEATAETSTELNPEKP